MKRVPTCQCDACRYARSQGLKQGRREERAAVVAWLRKLAPGVAFTGWVLNMAEDIEKVDHEP